MFQFKYFALCWFALYSKVFCNQFVFNCLVPNICLVFKAYAYHWFGELLKVINFVSTILLTEILYMFKTIKCWFTLYTQMYVLGLQMFCRSCLAFLPLFNILLFNIHSVICTLAIRNIRNIYAALANQTGDICILTINTLSRSQCFQDSITYYVQ